jgi:hypothetical protein
VFALKQLPWCLVEFLPLKVPASSFDLEIYILVVLCSMLKLEEFNSENYRNTLVIKVSKFSFSKMRVKKNPIQGQTYFSLHHKCD